MKLVAMAEVLANNLGQPFRHENSGGGSDGNFTGAIGVPTLDGLGVGDKFHTLDEHIEIDSLAMRGHDGWFVCRLMQAYNLTQTH